MKQGKKLKTDKYNVAFNNLPIGLNNLKIVNISDLHNANLKGAIEEKIANILPDIIVITGDFISYEKHYQNAMTVVNHAVKYAPTFYVSGNHEARFSRDKYLEFINRLKQSGVIVLENEVYHFNFNDSTLAIIGINDPKFFVGNQKQEFINMLKTLTNQCEGEFKLLLSHRPEFFAEYAKCGIELSLSGHVHGGGIRIPKFGAIFALNQGFFPKYADGLKSLDNHYMMISRGLGKTRFTPPRIFNPRELPVIILKCA